MSNVFGANATEIFAGLFLGCEGEVHDVERAIATARKVMARRDMLLTKDEEDRIRSAFEARLT